MEAKPEWKFSTYGSVESDATSASRRQGPSFFLSVIIEASSVFRIGFPNILQQLSSSLMLVSSLILVGRYAGNKCLASMALGSTFGSIAGMTLIMGMSEAIDTLCSRFYGAKKYRSMGRILFRGLSLLIGFSTICAVVFAFGAEILILMGQHKDLAHTAGSYMRCMIPGIFGYAVSTSFQRFLSAQQKTRPLYFVSCISLPLHVAITYLLVGVLGLKQVGAGLAWSLLHILRAGTLLGFTIYYETKKSPKTRVWGAEMELSDDPPLKESEYWMMLLGVSVPATIMLAAEFWAFQILLLMAGVLPDPDIQLTVTAICLNILGLMFMFPAGTSIATCVRIGHLLGNGKKHLAITTILASLLVCSLQWAIISSLLSINAVRDNVYLLFASSSTTSDAKLERLRLVIGRMIPIIITQQLFDFCKEVMNGVLRGLGRQSLGLITSVIAYFSVCVPLAYIFAFGKFGVPEVVQGVQGLFLATIVGSFVHAILNSVVVYTIDWKPKGNSSRNATPLHVGFTLPVLRADSFGDSL
mmetsp:Transcript_22761/g.33939  ORF Transcript_22761/g.33939 Transcript_22761/m.33939 type:complete len:527 (+) Transcript_22761:57-1637(+)